MRGLKDTWVGFLGVFIVLAISSAFVVKAIEAKADKRYVDDQIKTVIISVSSPIKDINCKLDTIIKQNRHERK